MRHFSMLMWGRDQTVLTMHFQNEPSHLSGKKKIHHHFLVQPVLHESTCAFLKGCETPQGIAQRKARENHRALNCPKQEISPLRNADFLWLQPHQVYVTPSQLDKMLTGIPIVYRSVNATSWREISFHIGNYLASLANYQHL